MRIPMGEDGRIIIIHGFSNQIKQQKGEKSALFLSKASQRERERI